MPSISDAVQPAQSVEYTYSWFDTSQVKLDKLRASAARQLRALGWPVAEIERFIAALGVPGARPSSSLEDKQLALKEVLNNAKELSFYAGKEHTATLTAGLHALREDKGTPILFCLKEPTAEGVGVAPDGSPTYTLEGCVEKISAAAAARGEAPPKLALVEDGDWAARALGATGNILRAALLALGPHAEHIGFGDIFTHIVAFRDAQKISFQANVHASLEGPLAAAHAMIE